MNTMTQTASAFFFEHAGYSVKQGETRLQGRRRCAKALAQAEAQGSAIGLSFQWEIDQTADSSDFSNEQPALATLGVLLLWSRR